MVVDYWEHSYKILFTHKSHRTGSCFVRWLLHITHRIILSRTATQASVFPTLSIAKGIFAFRSERDAGSRAGANVICREIEHIRSSSTRPAKRAAPPRKNRPTATPLLFFVYANPPDLHSVPYIQRYEQIRNRCFLLNRFLRRRKQERIMCCKWFSFRRGHERESVTGSAGLYRVHAAWFFPVPEIPEGKQERIMCSKWFSFRRGHERESVTGSAGLYRVRAVWIFPVPEIPEEGA